VLDQIILWTILFILVSSILGVFLARRKKDECLKDFLGYLSTVQMKGGKRVWGRLAVETSGIEFRYKGNYWDQDHIETSFIMYKEEFSTIQALFRFHDELDERERQKRLRALKKSYHPSIPRRLFRHMSNILNTIKDAFGEAVGGVLATQARTSNPALRAAVSQQRSVTRAQSEVLGYLGSSYDPILERYRGNMVVMEVTTPEGVIQEHVGVFKEYSTQFLEVMDVKYQDGEKARVCDMVVPRAHSVIRHSAEPIEEQATFQRQEAQVSKGG